MQRASFVLIFLMLTLTAFTQASSVSSNGIINVSIASNGTQSNGPSAAASISADGRYITFTSGGNNLVPGDTNAYSDVFIRDIKGGTTARISITPSGVQGNNFSGIFGSSISADGRYIAFNSEASNLIPEDTNRVVDIFVYSRETGEIERVSVSSSGAEANRNSLNSVMSADGHYVAFDSEATNLVPGDTTLSWDVFLYNRQNKSTTLISASLNGTPGGGSFPSISADGRYIAFHSGGSNLVISDTNKVEDTFVYDRNIGEMIRVSVDSDGKEANGRSVFPTISADGRFVVFVSSATNLVSGTSLGYENIYIHELATHATTRISVAADAGEANNASGKPSVSLNGNYVAFSSSASNLVVDDSNNVDDVFVYDRGTGTTTRISKAFNGVEANAYSVYPAISADGQIVAFHSGASNLVPNDANDWQDVFVYANGGNESPTPTPTVPITREPVIFIPGITGSYLFEVKGNDKEELWPAANWNLNERNQKHERLTLDPDQSSLNIIATDVLRHIEVDYVPDLEETYVYTSLLKALISNGYREYQVNNPVMRTEAGCDKAQKDLKPLLFVFAYDWRQDNGASADSLAEYVKCVRWFYPDSKINIIAHSMGGLVARRYILAYLETHNIDKLITIGTPWLGAPKAIMALETGEEFASWFVVSPLILKDLLVFFPGAHQLIPSDSYFALGGFPFREKGWNINNNTQDSETYSFRQMVSLLDTQFTTSTPGSATDNFHAFSVKASKQDDWRGDESGVESHLILGYGQRNDTIEQLVTVKRLSCINRICSLDDTFVVIRGKGDTTVPKLSAERIGNGINLNGKATLHHPSSGSQDHTGLTKNEEVQSLVLQLLDNQSGGNSMTTAMAEPPTEAAYYINISGVENLTATDINGNSTSPTSGQVFGNTVPEVIVDRLGENDYSLVLPKHQTYTITFAASGAPSQLEITDGTNITNTKLVRYLDLAIPPHVNAGFRLTPTTIEPLYVDTDGNGTPDSIIPPTADVTGSLASDTTPPSVTITHTQDGNKITVSINASDDTEVVKILYSLDGTHFDVYLGPFTLDVGQAKSIYAFADDKVANRSTLVVHTFAQNTYLPLIRQ